ncbi:MAG: TIM barrel protein [Chitinophagia bacterium]
MLRRNFVANSVLAGTAWMGLGWKNKNSIPTFSSLAGEPFQCNYAFHDGMFKNMAGENFIDQIRYAHSMGFRSIEDNGMMDRTPEMQQKIGDTLAELGMQMGVFVIQFDKWPLQTSLTSGKKEWRDKFLTYCKEAVEVAKRTRAKWMTVVPGNYDRSLSMGLQTGNVIESLRLGAEILAPHNLVMVLEPLSDTPDLFLRHSDQTYAICKAINSPACKILFDMYHMQRNEGNIIKNIEAAWDEIGYFQIGDNPGRKEPGTGEMNYKNIFKYIHQKGYRGIYGMEHGIAGKGKEGELALIEAYRQADNF